MKVTNEEIIESLLVGQLYSDTDPEHYDQNDKVLLRFVKIKNDVAFFKYEGGNIRYAAWIGGEENGLIGFYIHTIGAPFYKVEDIKPSIELSEKSLATITTALRRYFDDYPIVKGSKEDDVINAIDELIEKYDIKQLEPLRDEMNKDLDFESNQESNTDPNEDRENDVEWNNRPNQFI